MERSYAEEIASLVSEKDYESAYSAGKSALERNPGDPVILEALYDLTAQLRVEAIGFACKKANYSRVSPYETLLEKVNILTGQDIYGNFM